MKTIKGKVTIEDVEHDVELPLPEGYLTPEEIQETYVPKVSVENSTAAAVRSENQKLREKLLAGEDTDFLGEFKTRHNLVEPEETPPDLEERLERAKDDWTRTELEPERAKTKAQADLNRKLLASKLQSDILSAAGGVGVKQTLLAKGPNEIPQIVNMVGGFFAYDDDHGYFAVVEGRAEDGKPKFKFSLKGEAGRPHMSVEEYMEGWAADPLNADFIGERQRGAELGDTVGKESGKNVVISATDAQDVSKYRAAKKKAEELGGTVLVEQDDVFSPQG